MTPLDLQVNGFAGVDFNAPGLTPESLRAACAAYRAAGGGQFLATLITADIPTLCERLRALVSARAADPLAAGVIAGVHLEGPFISPLPGYVGAHPPEFAVPGDTGATAELLDAGAGLARLVTLAPERDPGLRVTAMLRSAGVLVAAGHADPPGSLLDEAIEAGVRLFTHLGNGCPNLLPRHDNVISRVLDRADRLAVSLIPDGVHVPYFVLRQWLKLIPPAQVVFVSDAISAAGLGPGTFTLGRRAVEVGADGVARCESGGHFVGSTVTPSAMLANAAVHLGLAGPELVAALDANPRRLLAGA